MSTSAFHSQLTLREAIALLHHRLGDDLVVGGEDGAMFEAHDACHAVFGCDLTIRGEALVDTWTLFASTVTVAEFLRYANHPSVRAVLAKAGWVRLTWQGTLAIPWVITVLWRGLQMSQSWSFWDWRDHLDETLAEIRLQHGIVPVSH